MNTNLELYFEEKYNEQLQELETEVENLYKIARDKRYALELAFGIYGFAAIFTTGSNFFKRAMEDYDHIYKLGGGINEFIESLPELKESYKKDEENFREENSKTRRVKLKFKKLWNIIPIKFEGIEINHDDNPYFFSDTLLDLTDPKEIVADFAKKKAHRDFFYKLKTRVENLGGNTQANIIDHSTDFVKISTALENEDLESFFTIFKSLFASIAYDIKAPEGYFHVVIHTALKVAGIKLDSESQTNVGRIDIVVETTNTIYIFEFKITSVEEALKQIHEKKYYEKFIAAGKKILLVGVSFDEKAKNIKEWKSENFQP